jgi:hypothetical protein
MRVLLPVLLATLLGACGDTAATPGAVEDASTDVSAGEDADAVVAPVDTSVEEVDSTLSDTAAPSDVASDTAKEAAVDTGIAPSCVDKGGFCTWAGAYRCCSGRCDGDSCLGYDVGHACSSNSECQRNNCVGGVCACAIGDAPCGTAGASVDIENNDAHCGACGKACGPNQRCLSGKCECRDSFTTNCGADCYDTRTEEAHCGGCGKACRSDQLCAFSACQCATGSECAGKCVFFGSDPNNCGTCGTVCPTSKPRCNGGVCACATGLTQCSTGCMNLQTDRTNCGTCGNVCNGMKSCVGGVCL